MRKLNNLNRIREFSINTKNKIVYYQQIKRRILSNNDRILSFSGIGNNVILNFLIALLYLFSALEEADWNILSADSRMNSLVEDSSPWNINELFYKFKYAIVNIMSNNYLNYIENNDVDMNIKSL